MTFEIVSALSWDVLGTFEDEQAAREAVRVSVLERGADVRDVVVYESDEHGQHVREHANDELAAWAGIATGHATAV